MGFPGIIGARALGRRPRRPIFSISDLLVTSNADREWTGVAFGKGVFVRCGWRTTGTTGRIEWSDDGGLTWTEVVDAAITAPQQLYGAMFAPTNDKFYVVEFRNDAPGNLYYSSDGKVWSVATGVLPYRCFQIHEVAGSGVLLAGGVESPPPFLARSADGGLNWTSPTVPSGGVYVAGFMSSATAIVVAAKGISGAVFAIRSTDGGLTWSAVSSPAESNAYMYTDGNSFVSTAVKMVAVGGHDSLLGAAWVSEDDGLTWTPYVVSPDTEPTPIARVAGFCVALYGYPSPSGAEPGAWVSVDGKDWLNLLPASDLGDPFSFNAIAWDSSTGALVAVGGPQSGSSPSKTLTGTVKP